ncbi:MAG: YncE family protein, partial [bacterium]
MRIFHIKIVWKNLLAVLFLVIAFQSNVAAREYYVYVATESEDEVALVKFDEKQATVAKHIPVGVWPVEIEGPHGITVSPDGQTWYLSMAHGKPFGYVYKFKTGTDEMVGRVQLGLFPATMQVSPATGLLYVVNFNLHGDHVPSTVSVVDPESMEEIQRIQTGVMPHGSRLSPDGLKHYSVAMMDDELFEIDALTMEVSRRLNVAGATPAGNTGMANLQNMQHAKPRAKPTWATPHPKKPLVYVANNGANEIVEIDLNAWKVTRRFPTAP